MTHPQYTVKYLTNKGLGFCKKVANELGVEINGDKRLISTYVDAIVSFQASQFEVVEAAEQVATIERTADDKYAVVVNGVVHQDFYSYMDAERCVLRKNWILLDTQEVAQGELETEIEIQATEISAPDITFRDIEFGYTEATVIVDGSIKVLAEICYDFEEQIWSVNDREQFSSYAEAENWVLVNATALSEEDQRGSGRIVCQVIESTAFTIEDMNATNHHGAMYQVRICGDLIGNIFDSPQGWTINSIEFHQNWVDAAKQLEEMYIYCTA